MEPEYCDGDTVYLDPTNSSLRNGSVVAALIDGSDSTLKIYSQNDKTITLTPINPAYKPRTYKTKQVTVQGVVMKVVKKQAG
jgi:repressor LexA